MPRERRSRLGLVWCSCGDVVMVRRKAVARTCVHIGRVPSARGQFVPLRTASSAGPFCTALTPTVGPALSLSRDAERRPGLSCAAAAFENHTPTEEACPPGLR
ncbi:hypothetical protein MRX96_012244 [Rhipicephalus microplus]